MMHITILNGPNLNMLGSREPDVYGHVTLEMIEQQCCETAATQDIEVHCAQSNHEGELIDWIQQSQSTSDGLIINAGAYTHTSVAIHDALKSLSIPIIELHISNVFQREEFRHRSFISEPATAVICGLGAAGYPVAIGAMQTLIEEAKAHS